MWFICNKLGLGDEYQKIYGVNSLSVHSDPLIENLMTTGKSLTIVPFDSEHISRIACVSLDISLKSIVSTIGHFDLEFSEGLERYGDFLFVGACHKDKGR